jgi:hypothetical protein
MAAMGFALVVGFSAGCQELLGRERLTAAEIDQLPLQGFKVDAAALGPHALRPQLPKRFQAQARQRRGDAVGDDRREQGMK